MAEEIVDGFDDGKIYVAVSKEVKACKSTLVWAFQNSGGKRICLIHVHQPAQTISILGGKFPISSLSEQQVRSHQEKERENMCKILDEYLRLCAKTGVQAEKLYIEKDLIEEGIVELVSQHKIVRLVMGAAADSKYSRKMLEPKSKKANYVRQHAPSYCHIRFICKGRLIHTRESIRNPKPRLLIQSASQRSNISHSKAESEASFDEASTFSLSQLSIFSRSSSAITETLAACSMTEERERELSSGSLSLPPTNSLAKAMENLYYEELSKRRNMEEDLAKVKEELESTKEERDMAIEQLRIAMDQKVLLERRIEESDKLGKDLEGRIMYALEFLQNYAKL